MDNKFSLKNFIEREAEEEIVIKNKDSTQIQEKDTQDTSELNKVEDDSYGIPSDNDTEKNSPRKISKELNNHRLILQKEIEKEENKIKKDLKRKVVPHFNKLNKKKGTLHHVKKNMNKIEDALGISNGKLNIGFYKNKENENINDVKDESKTPEKKFKDEEDEEIIKLKMSNQRKKIENVNKKNNKDFIRRIKENETFIKNNNIIISEGNNINTEKNIKRNKSANDFKLKLFTFKGAFLNRNKKMK